MGGGTSLGTLGSVSTGRFGQRPGLEILKSESRTVTRASGTQQFARAAPTAVVFNSETGVKIVNSNGNCSGGALPDRRVARPRPVRRLTVSPIV